MQKNIKMDQYNMHPTMCAKNTVSTTYPINRVKEQVINKNENDEYMYIQYVVMIYCILLA